MDNNADARSFCVSALPEKERERERESLVLGLSLRRERERDAFLTIEAHLCLTESLIYFVVAHATLMGCTKEGIRTLSCKGATHPYVRLVICKVGATSDASGGGGEEREPATAGLCRDGSARARAACPFGSRPTWRWRPCRRGAARQPQRRRAVAAACGRGCPSQRGCSCDGAGHRCPPQHGGRARRA